MSRRRHADPMSPRPVRAAIYCRISNDRTSEGLGVERQRRDCLALAASLGWPVEDTYIDNDISAYSGKRRPEYERLLADIGSRRITGLIAWHPDRLNRSPLELERLINILETNHVAVQSVTAGPIDLATASGRAVARTLGAWARFESEHRSERNRAKAMEIALAGRINGGANRPFGYEDDKTTVNRVEAKVLREMVRRVLAGENIAALCRDLNRREIATTGGKRWTPPRVKTLVMSPRIAGWRSKPGTFGRYGSEFLVVGQWPAIVSRRDVESVRELLADDTSGAGRRRWFLTGILRCERCGYPMMARARFGKTRPENQYDYACCRIPGEGCGRRSIALISTDTYITDQIATALAGGILDRLAAAGDDLYRVEHQIIAAYEQETRQTTRDYNNGDLGRNEWRRRINRLAKRRRTITAELDDMPSLGALAAVPTDSELVAVHMARMPLRSRRALVRALTTSITIAAGRRGAPLPVGPRITIDWRA